MSVLTLLQTRKMLLLHIMNLCHWANEDTRAVIFGSFGSLASMIGWPREIAEIEYIADKLTRATRRDTISATNWKVITGRSRGT